MNIESKINLTDLELLVYEFKQVFPDKQDSLVYFMEWAVLKLIKQQNDK